LDALIGSGLAGVAAFAVVLADFVVLDDVLDVVFAVLDDDDVVVDFFAAETEVLRTPLVVD
jgi:hypothetical protein